MTAKITTIPGYQSVADLPTANERILIVGTGKFEDFEFAGEVMWPIGTGPTNAGPTLVQPQIYFYPVPTLLAAGRPRPKGGMIQMQRETLDPTADDSIIYPSDWPFSYLPYLGPPAIDYVQPNGKRGFRLKFPTGTVIHMGTHILKGVNVADLIGGRIPFEVET